MPKYWIAVASQEHVQRGIAEGFCQVCHGKPGPLNRMHKSDWIIYYSPTQKFGEKDSYQKFTALGKIQAKEPYQVSMSKDFTPWRRDVTFIPVTEVSIIPLIAKLSFIKNKSRWGFPFRRGYFEISQQDFKIIIQAMGFENESAITF